MYLNMVAISAVNKSVSESAYRAGKSNKLVKAFFASTNGKKIIINN